MNNHPSAYELLAIQTNLVTNRYYRTIDNIEAQVKNPEQHEAVTLYVDRRPINTRDACFIHDHRLSVSFVMTVMIPSHFYIQYCFSSLIII